MSTNLALPEAVEDSNSPRLAEGPQNSPLLTALFLAIFGLSFPLGFQWTVAFAGLLALGGLLSLFSVRLGKPSALLAFVILIAAWANCTLLWANEGVVPAHLAKFKDLNKFTSLTLIFEVLLYGALWSAIGRLNKRESSMAISTITASVIALIIAISLDTYNNAGVYFWISHLFDNLNTRIDLARLNLSVGIDVCVVLFWAASFRIAELRQIWLIPVLSVCLVVSGVSLHDTDAALLAFFLGAVTFGWVRFFGGVSVCCLAVLTTIYWLGAPLVIWVAQHTGALAFLQIHVRGSWQVRLDIWSFATSRIVEEPWIGWGIDASRTFGNAISLHTHDAALQIWLELGLVGAVLVAGFWIAVWLKILKLVQGNRDIAGLCAATAVTYLTMGGLSFGVWQAWWIAVGVLSALACACLCRARLDTAVSLRDATGSASKGQMPAAWRLAKEQFTR